ncbi:MAG TPA: ABC transporter ATP-binding protein [Thermoleophilia bacterium]|nr:ABC transporter ATP-binding protein [Thermoleophilia bacterium]
MEATTRPDRPAESPSASANAGNSNTIRLEQAAKTYGEGPTAVEALKPTDLLIERGELVVVLGPSGSGKTTLLNLIGAIEPPSSGRLTVAGQELSTLDDGGRTRFRRETVGFVFQFFNLIPTLTALENVQLIAELVEGDSEESGRRALEGVGLAERLDHFPGALSGGEQQRVAIARALAKHPPLLLCDEPTGSLDLTTGRQILDLLQRLTREEGRTMLLVTHNEAIAKIATRVLRMRSGRISQDHRNDHPASADQVTW